GDAAAAQVEVNRLRADVQTRTAGADCSLVCQGLAIISDRAKVPKWRCQHCTAVNGDARADHRRSTCGADLPKGVGILRIRNEDIRVASESLSGRNHQLAAGHD